ncbi:A-kinase anchor protein 17A [Hypsibius exemplaris]|uniref:A-kinase anchor protein 17A n=1 Tax=Hypsibius exemplaris TaxID=2072580 RepID=A0A9X6NF86_HYPEX|nr:A-kinase anchor protein 17A [Hypsibius exemplaris]
MSSALLQPCTDLTDVLTLSASAALYLKPIARVTVAVALPKSLSATAARPGSVGKSISNWEVMEKVKSLARPIVFSVMKVTTSTLEVIRYEGELDNKDLLMKVVHALDGQTIKLSGYSEVLRVSCVETKLNFPQRHDWTAFFRDAQNVNELKPGERPDTVFLQNLPCKWFAEQPTTVPGATSDVTAASSDVTAAVAQQSSLPSARKVKEIFELFGEVRAVDMPVLDPCRNGSAKVNGMTSNLLTLGHELVFDAYVQFSVYNSFVKCLTALCGMKLLWKESAEKASTANIKVEFDKTQHMSDKNRRKRRHDRVEYRRLEKERELKARQEAEEAEKRKCQEEQRAAEESRIQEEKRLEREERRRHQRELKVQKADRRRKAHEDKQRRHEVAVEERKLLLAQRQLESIRLLSSLFDRLKEKRVVELVELEKIRQEQEEIRRKEEERQREIAKDNEFRDMLTKKEQELRSILLKSKRHEERKRKRQEEKHLKRIKRRDRKIRKNLLNPTKLPNITPDLQRFLDDLPVLYDGPIPHLNAPPSPRRAALGDNTPTPTAPTATAGEDLSPVVRRPVGNSAAPPQRPLSSPVKKPVTPNALPTAAASVAKEPASAVGRPVGHSAAQATRPSPVPLKTPLPQNGAPHPNRPLPSPKKVPLTQNTVRARISALPHPTDRPVAISTVRQNSGGTSLKRPISSPKEVQAAAPLPVVARNPVLPAVKRPRITHVTGEDEERRTPPPRSIVVVVPAESRTGKEPLFTTPKNILYC